MLKRVNKVYIMNEMGNDINMELKQSKDGNIKAELKIEDLGMKFVCIYCGSGGNRIIKGNKKWKCLDCFKSFKKPKVVGSDSSNIPNIKTFKAIQGSIGNKAVVNGIKTILEGKIDSDRVKINELIDNF